MRKRAGLLALSVVTVSVLGLGSPPAPVAAQASQNVAADIAEWDRLRRNDSLPFENYAYFILAHRGWPAEAALRRTAERRVQPGVSGLNDVIRYFTAVPPLSPVGHARFASALNAAGRVPEARAAAREAWTGGQLPVEDEQRLLSTFGSAFTQADHDQRIDVLLSGGYVSDAQRAMGFASAARRPFFAARIALQSRSAEAPALVEALGASAARDPGLLLDRAGYMNRNGNAVGARQLLAQRRSLASRPANPERFLTRMVEYARAAAGAGQHALAWSIASQVDDIYAPGTDVSALSFGERDQYTNLTWLAGTTALQRLGQPREAVGMFERYGRAAQSPQTRTKGLFWAGRAAQVAGDAQRSRTLWAEAARNYDHFYGQLAAERLGQPYPPVPAEMGQATPAERQAFNSRSHVAAIRHLGSTGRWSDQSVFIRALAEHVETDAERRLAGELGQQIGRPDLGVWTSREARRPGVPELRRWGFPELQVPPQHQRLWSVVHAITRQESLFDRQAQSPVGARGLMQLMPGTARQVSGRVGESYALGRLTSDPSYNVLLGSTYFASLLDEWTGSYVLAVASYNAGPGNVRRWINANGDPRNPGVDIVEWIERIPFTETRNYVHRVLENAVDYDLLHPQRSGSPASGRLSFYLGRRAQ